MSNGEDPECSAALRRPIRRKFERSLQNKVPHDAGQYRRSTPRHGIGNVSRQCLPCGLVATEHALHTCGRSLPDSTTKGSRAKESKARTSAKRAVALAAGSHSPLLNSVPSVMPGADWRRRHEVDSLTDTKNRSVLLALAWDYPTNPQRLILRESANSIPYGESRFAVRP